MSEYNLKIGDQLWSKQFGLQDVVEIHPQGLAILGEERKLAVLLQPMLFREDVPYYEVHGSGKKQKMILCSPVPKNTLPKEVETLIKARRWFYEHDFSDKEIVDLYLQDNINKIFKV